MEYIYNITEIVLSQSQVMMAFVGKSDQAPASSYDAVGWISEMTYSVWSGMLNPTIHTILGKMQT